MVGVVGPTGAGKTTFTSLISRLYDPTEGRVLLDGHDLRDLTLDCVRSSVAVVLQEPLLFLASIADNIRYGRLDATYEEVVEAAKAAHAHDFISALPDGYDTRIGERGATLSGGERQRICIARAFLKDAPIVILDEPTSAVDSRTEGDILGALERLTTGKTTLIVAHRLSTLRSANRILVFEGGQVVEDGPHEDLLKLEGGLYRRLWATQAGLDWAVTPSAQTPGTVSTIVADSHTSLGTTPAERPSGNPVMRPKIVVLGMMSKTPVAGVVWQTLHYMIGLRRLGFDPYYVEAHARTPSMLMVRPDQDSAELAAAFIADVMSRYDFADRWAFHALHDDGRCLGMDKGQLMRLYADAALILNLHGGTEPREEHARTGRLVYLETDPCQLQVELATGEARTVDFLSRHQAFFTFGENIGKPDCLLPVSDRFHFVPTRQPVVLDLWDPTDPRPGTAYTTVGNWRQQWRDLSYNGEVYHWSKHSEFLRVLDLPARSAGKLELALSSYEDEDRVLLERHGWQVRPALSISLDIGVYRSYISGSRGEFTVAKDQNIRMRSGWFSDRSATYLASGRPVITQDTGFVCSLPIGEGLFAYSSVDEAEEAIARVESDYTRHSDAARRVAADYFAAEKVLADLTGHLGLSARSSSAVAAIRPTPADELVLTPVSRRPLKLPDATHSAVLSRAVPPHVHAPEDDLPGASVVVVTHDNLVCLRLCVESILTKASGVPVELIVVDNASTDGTGDYLAHLARVDCRVRVTSNSVNAGFAAAVNQGLAIAGADHFVIMNDDTIVCDGWLDGLLSHLGDPAVGAVGPVTGRIGTASEIQSDYRTLSELTDFAAGRQHSYQATTFDVTMLAMFCMALRRGTFERVGPLDEGFGLGLFEDDDYSRRLRDLGYRLVCADGIFVHHFGEASFGSLVASGEYRQLFDTNRSRYERKWGTEWRSHERRGDPSYAAVVAQTKELLFRELPAEAVALVLSKGDPDLIDVPCRAEHFPQTPSGQYAGQHPTDSAEALAWLVRDARHCGAGYLVVPCTSAWWLTHYPGLLRPTSCASRGRMVAYTAVDAALFAPPTDRNGHTSPPAGGRGMTSCSIVVPVFNGAGLTAKCLDTLIDTWPTPAQQVIVVDDGSSDGTADVLADAARREPRLTIVRRRFNAGFATACNDGARAATGDYLVFLNNDTEPVPGWLDALAIHADSHPSAGVVGAKLLYPDRTVQHAGIVFDTSGNPRHAYCGFPAEHPAVSKSRAWQAVTGAAMLVRRELLRSSLGGFDSSYRNGHEDIDLCLRARRNREPGALGLHESLVVHLESASRGRHTAETTANGHLFRSRWGQRVSPDDLDRYRADGLVRWSTTTMDSFCIAVAPKARDG